MSCSRSYIRIAPISHHHYTLTAKSMLHRRQRRPQRRRRRRQQAKQPNLQCRCLGRCRCLSSSSSPLPPPPQPRALCFSFHTIFLLIWFGFFVFGFFSSFQQFLFLCQLFCCYSMYILSLFLSLFFNRSGFTVKTALIKKYTRPKHIQLFAMRWI